MYFVLFSYFLQISNSLASTSRFAAATTTYGYDVLDKLLFFFLLSQQILLFRIFFFFFVARNQPTNMVVFYKLYRYSCLIMGLTITTQSIFFDVQQNRCNFILYISIYTNNVLILRNRKREQPNVLSPIVRRERRSIRLNILQFMKENYKFI